RPDRRDDEHVDRCKRVGDSLVRDGTLNADEVLSKQRRELRAIAVVTVIGTRRAEQIDGRGAARKTPDGFEKNMRRLRHHQAAKKSQSQVRRRAFHPEGASERTVIESIWRQENAPRIDTESDETVTDVTRRSEKNRDLRAHTLHMPHAVHCFLFD